MSWLYFHLGLSSGNSPWYLFPSGALGYVVFFSALSILIGFWRVHTCHTHWWCWRRPLFSLPGSPFKTCHFHHPDDQMTPRQALKAAQNPYPPQAERRV